VIGGRRLSLPRAVRAGDFVFLAGQMPFKNGQVMTTGTVEEQTRAGLEMPVRGALGRLVAEQALEQTGSGQISVPAIARRLFREPMKARALNEGGAKR